MSINIHQIQSLLSTYHRQQIQSRLSDARSRSSTKGTGQMEEKVLISAEAKRLQIYQRTAEEVQRRMRDSTREGEARDIGEPITSDAAPGLLAMDKA
jgi:hypothetical protein